MGTVLAIGNCQVYGMAQCASHELGRTTVFLHPNKVREKPEFVSASLKDAEVVFASSHYAEQLKRLLRDSNQTSMPVITCPKLHFLGFHPDATTPAKAPGKMVKLPMGNSNSAILLAAWGEELSPKEAVTLFCDEVYEALGYYRAFSIATEVLIDQCETVGLDAKSLIPGWMATGPFFYLPIHPKMRVLRDIALAQLKAAGICETLPAADVVGDNLSRNFVWPVYPEIAQRLGIEGDYIFRPRTDLPDNHELAPPHLAPMDLESFVERTFAAYRESPPDFSAFPRMKDSSFIGLRRFLRRTPSKHNANPYSDLAPEHWWSKAVAGLPMDRVDPVYRAKFKIGRSDRIATAGSCFAQHIARRLQQEGFNYFVTERAPEHCSDPAGEHYGTFTARFGNIYTVRQLLQLIDRAYGRFHPAIDAWKLRGDAGYVDPFRPRIGPKPFASLEELSADRDVHFTAVRRMFESADVFIFTLGLTECWWSRRDQAVVPLPPAAVGVDVDADAYEPKNFTVAEVSSDLQQLISFLQGVNTRLRIILTVSPVPLIATFEKEHVLAATTYSKSVLRVAAGETASQNDHVAYFPSYEIITGSFNRGRYFGEDLREVTSAGVDQVMRCFLRHYPRNGADPVQSDALDARFPAQAEAEMEIVCDEEEIEAAALAQRRF